MPTLLQLHLHELHCRFMVTHHRGMQALSASELERFAEAVSEERGIIQEWRAALSDYAEQCHKRRRSVRERLQRRTKP